MDSFLANFNRTLQSVLERSAGAVAGRAAPAAAAPAPRAVRSYRCVCGRPVFFGNSRCLACGQALGFAPATLRVLALKPVDGELVSQGPAAVGQRFVRCANAESPAACNWLIPAQERNARGLRPLWCVACRLNRTIPDLSVPANAMAWARLEDAKRRLVSQLLDLGLPVASRLDDAGGEDPARGLIFDFLRAYPGGPAVLTGHANGVITVNVDEADDVMREQARTSLREKYRTLLGHLRHEVGHYYWSRLVADSTWLERFRSVFGDERQSYGAALQRYYEQGAEPGWPDHHVSAYASSHPWEDWAETWAHYLHMIDGLETGQSFGLDASDVQLDIEPFTATALGEHDAGFLRLVNAWVELTGVLNELSRSLGEPDFYPFVLSQGVVRKLHLVHRVVQAAAKGRSAAQ